MPESPLEKLKHRLEAQNKDWFQYIPYHYLRHDPCVYCGRVSESWDHIDPIYGGSQTKRKNNVARACLDCNQRKGQTPLLLFLCGYRRFIRYFGTSPKSRRRLEKLLLGNLYRLLKQKDEQERLYETVGSRSDTPEAEDGTARPVSPADVPMEAESTE
jgi:hypothetical protein